MTDLIQDEHDCDPRRGEALNENLLSQDVMMIELEPSHSVVTLIIVSSNHFVRAGLRAVIQHKPHLRLVGDVASAMEVEDTIVRKQPHVLIIHQEFDVDILNLIPKLKEYSPTTKIVALTDLEDTWRTRELLSAGIDGIVLNSQPPAVILTTIDYVTRGLPMGAQNQKGTGRPDGNQPVDAIDRADPTSPRCLNLVTQREGEVIALVREGLSNKEIAAHLGISSITVRHHLTSIFDKLGVPTRQKLLVLAHQEKLVAPRGLDVGLG